MSAGVVVVLFCMAFARDGARQVRVYPFVFCVR